MSICRRCGELCPPSNGPRAREFCSARCKNKFHKHGRQKTPQKTPLSASSRKRVAREHDSSCVCPSTEAEGRPRREPAGGSEGSRGWAADPQPNLRGEDGTAWREPAAPSRGAAAVLRSEPPKAASQGTSTPVSSAVRIVGSGYGALAALADGGVNGFWNKPVRLHVEHGSGNISMHIPFRVLLIGRLL